MLEFREHDNTKSPDPTSKAQLRNWNAVIWYNSENNSSAAQSMSLSLEHF